MGEKGVVFFCLSCDACNCRCSCIVLSVCFSMHVVCPCLVHPVAVCNAAFGMTYSLLVLVEDATGDHMNEAYSESLS